MCSPEGLGAAGAIGSIAGAFGANSAARAQAQMMRQLGQAQQAAYNAAAEIDDMNAGITFQQAGVAVEQGNFNLRLLKSKGAQVQGAQKAAVGAAGLATTSGTPALILSDTAAQLAMDVEAMRLNNRRAKWAFDVQATNYRNSAEQKRYAGKAAAAGSNYQAAVTEQAAQTSLLSGITSSLFRYGDSIGLMGKSSKPSIYKASSWRRGG